MFLRRIYGDPPDQGVPSGWEIVLLDQIAKRGSGHTPDKKKPEYWNGGIRWVSLADSDKLDQIYIFDTDKEISELGIANSSAVKHPQGTVIVSRDAGVGKSAILGHEMAVSQHFIAWLCGPHLDNHFLYYMLQLMKPEFERMAVGSTIKTIGLRYFEKLQIPLPPLPEQRKIAQILSTWDEAIALVEALIAALSERKKGLMQRLLTGEVRFPGFVESDAVIETKFGEIPADWEYVPINEIAKAVSAKNADGAILPVLSCTKYDGLVDSLEYFGRQIFSEDTSTYKVVERNQFAYATNHIEEGSIGYQDLYDRALISPMYTVFQTAERINDRYLYKVLKTELYRHIFEVSTSASVNRRGSLRWGEFSKIHVPLPGLEEQKYIADVIDSANVVAEQYIELRDTLREQKKGLMQRLLTGEVRVRVEE